MTIVSDPPFCVLCDIQECYCLDVKVNIFLLFKLMFYIFNAI